MTRVRPEHLFPVAVAAIAMTALLVVVWCLAVDLPHWDEWEFAPFLTSAAQGNLTASDFFAQYNEHRMAVARVVIWAFAMLTGWNLRAQSFVAPALAMLTLLLLVRVGRVTNGFHHPSAWVAFAISAVLLFSPTQNDNWMMALQFVFFVPGACLAGILAAAGTQWRWWLRWGAAVALAAVASFSIVTGFLLWVLGLPALLWPPVPNGDRERWPGVLVWAIACGMTSWAFFHGYVPVTEHPSAAAALDDPARSARYLLTFLGAPFARGTAWPSERVATVPGLMLLAASAAAIVWLFRRPSLWRPATPWLSVGGFALANAVAGVLMRSGFGLQQALASRYATFSLLLPVSLVWLGALAASRRAREGVRATPTQVASVAGLIATMMTLLALSSVQAVADMQGLARTLRASRAAIGFVGRVPDQAPFAGLFSNMAQLESLADALWRAGCLRPARRGSAMLPAPGDTAATAAAGWLERGALAGGRVTLEGWAVIPGRRASADLVAIAADDGHAARVVAFATMQPDVVKAYLGGTDGYRERAGWQATIDTSAIPPGTLLVSAWALDADSGRAFRLNGEWRPEAP